MNHVGPLIDRSAIEMFTNALKEIKKEGGKIIFGGDVLSGLGYESECYVKPAIAEVENLAQKYIPSGYSHSFFGQAEAFRESFQYLMMALLQAIVIVYMVLAMQFNSFLHPLTVMLALPLSTVGAFGALYVTGDTISIISMIGMITLTALVVKNSILLVDYTNTLRERGKERNQAVLEAAPVRLRPILMTAVTTIMGVLPVALGYSAGGN
jgi:multidrug efflux pump subunit AcrB